MPFAPSPEPSVGFAPSTEPSVGLAPSTEPSVGMVASAPTVASASAATVASMVGPASIDASGVEASGAPDSMLSGALTQHGLPVFVSPAEFVRLVGQSCAPPSRGAQHAPLRQYAVHEAKTHVPPAEAQAVPSVAPLDELHAMDIDPSTSGNQSQRMAGNYLMTHT